MCTKQARTFYNSFPSFPSPRGSRMHAHTLVHPHTHARSTLHTPRRMRSRGAASRDGSGTTHRPPGSPGVTCLEAASQRKSRPLRYGVWIKYYFRAYTPAGRDGRRRLPGTPSSPRLKRTWRGKTPANWLTRGDMGGITLVPRLSGVGARISADDENAFVLFFFRILFLSSFVSASCVGDRDSLLREQFLFDNIRLSRIAIRIPWWWKCIPFFFLFYFCCFFSFDFESRRSEICCFEEF